MIPDSTIERIRDSVDLVELVREHVSGLKKRGRNYQARCPFHQEKTPSFHVNPEIGIFKCFGCSAGGDAFKFVMLLENLTYPEAIRKLAGRVGIAIEEVQNTEQSQEAREKVQLFNLLELAAKFYRRCLMESREAQAAREYLQKRGVTAETQEKFLIGFAPASGQALLQAATAKGWDVSVLEKAGLVRRRESNGRPYDLFWGRIIFPIWDVQGRLIAFGGRVLGDGLPKYINSPETPVYTKSRHMYGFFQGLPAIRKERHLIVLEGYMDVVGCQQAGFLNTAATLGTALTQDHITLIRRYVDRVTLLFDPDAAGAAAALRGGEMLVSQSFDVRVCVLEDGKDPDEVLLEQGNEGLIRQLDKSPSFIEFCIQKAMQQNPALQPNDKLAIAKKVLPVIQKVQDPLLREEYLALFADRIHVDKNVLGKELGVLVRPSRSGAAETPTPTPSEKRSPILSVEEEMLLIFLLYPGDESYDLLKGHAWKDSRCEQLWRHLSALDYARGKASPHWHASIADELKEWLGQMMLEERLYAKPMDVLQHLSKAAGRQQDQNEWAVLKPEIDSMIEGRIPMDAEKYKRFQALSKLLKGSMEASSHG